MFAPKYEGIAALRSMDELGKKTIDLQVNISSYKSNSMFVCL